MLNSSSLSEIKEMLYKRHNIINFTKYDFNDLSQKEIQQYLNLFDKDWNKYIINNTASKYNLFNLKRIEIHDNYENNYKYFKNNIFII